MKNRSYVDPAVSSRLEAHSAKPKMKKVISSQRRSHRMMRRKTRSLNRVPLLVKKVKLARKPRIALPVGALACVNGLRGRAHPQKRQKNSPKSWKTLLAVPVAVRNKRSCTRNRVATERTLIIVSFDLKCFNLMKIPTMK
jgi:hypothetical protein